MRLEQIGTRRVCKTVTADTHLWAAHSLSPSPFYSHFPLPHYNISLLNWVTARSIHTYVGADDDEQDEQRVERVCCYSTSAAVETVEAKAATTPAATAVGHLLSICVLVSLSASTALCLGQYHRFIPVISGHLLARIK